MFVDLQGFDFFSGIEAKFIMKTFFIAAAADSLRRIYEAVVGATGVFAICTSAQHCVQLSV